MLKNNSQIPEKNCETSCLQYYLEQIKSLGNKYLIVSFVVNVFKNKHHYILCLLGYRFI
jgi:hypothetical protein